MSSGGEDQNFHRRIHRRIHRFPLGYGSTCGADGPYTLQDPMGPYATISPTVFLLAKRCNGASNSAEDIEYANSNIPDNLLLFVEIKEW
jgi:hypothetical protein